jgi:UDP-glucuronate decarboxylase
MSGELRLAVSGGPPKHFPLVRKLVTSDQKRILVTGGAGFVGSNLVDVLMSQGHIVYVLDNLFTGALSVDLECCCKRDDNIVDGRRPPQEHWALEYVLSFVVPQTVRDFGVSIRRGFLRVLTVGHPNFAFFQQDVTEPFYIEVDEIYHLACPASPPHYQFNPIKTIKTSTQGTLNMLGLAKRTGARLLFTSTSEVIPWKGGLLYCVLSASLR